MSMCLQSSHLKSLTMRAFVYKRAARKMPENSRPSETATLWYGLKLNGSSNEGITPEGGSRARSVGATTTYVCAAMLVVAAARRILRMWSQIYQAKVCNGELHC